MSRLFQLNRKTDIPGVSGTGIIADGVIFPSGKVALNWRGETTCTVVHDCIENVQKIHCFGGHTTIEYVNSN